MTNMGENYLACVLNFSSENHSIFEKLFYFLSDTTEKTFSVGMGFFIHELNEKSTGIYVCFP